MHEGSDQRPTRELRPTELQTLLRGPDAVNLEVEVEVVPEGAPLHVIDEGSSLAIPIAPQPPRSFAAGSEHALVVTAEPCLAIAGGPQPRGRIAMRALTARGPLYPRAPGGPSLASRIAAIAFALALAFFLATVL